MASEFDKAIRLACELLPTAQAEALRLAIKAETDNFNAVLERTWASQRDLAAARDAATAALAESEARVEHESMLRREAEVDLHAQRGSLVEAQTRSERAEARRAEAERLLTDERADADAMLTRTRNSLTTELNAALQRAEAAESSLAAAVEVLRQVDAKRHGSCWWCGRMPGEEHGNGCDLARALGGGRG